MSCVVLLAALAAAGCTGSRQPPAVEWQRTVGDEPNYGSSVQQTRDGGYIVTGVSATDTFPLSLFSPDILVVKLDSLGTTEWERSYGGPDLDFADAVKQTPDGGYVFAGTMDERLESSRAVVVKLDAVGHVQWSDSGPARARADDVAPTADGGYVSVGGWQTMYLRKLDPAGHLLWHVDLPEGIYPGGAYPKFPRAVQQTSDGGYITSYENVFKTDSLGILQWSCRFDDVTVLFSTRQTADGGYIATGIAPDPQKPENELNLVLLKMDAQGNKVWKRLYRDDGPSRGSCVRELPDGGYFVTGAGSGGPYLLRTDAHGNRVWAFHLPGFDDEAAHHGVPTSDGGFIVTVNRNLVKLAPEGK